MAARSGKKKLKINIRTLACTTPLTKTGLQWLVYAHSLQQGHCDE